MNNIKIDSTERSPEIEFDFVNNSFLIAGESYPEDISSLYGPVIASLEKYLESQKQTEITFNFKLIYFNSSSARVIMGLFDLLDKSAENNSVIINWYFEEDDDTMEELGEEFSEDLVNAVFNLLPTA